MNPSISDIPCGYIEIVLIYSILPAALRLGCLELVVFAKAPLSALDMTPGKAFALVSLPHPAHQNQLQLSPSRIVSTITVGLQSGNQSDACRKVQSA